MPANYAQIILVTSQRRVDRIYTYSVPESIRGEIRPGLACEVPFGQGNKVQRGFVISLAEDTELEKDLVKPLIRLTTSEPVFTEAQLKIARWMREQYDAPLGACLGLFVPRTATRKPRKKQSVLLPEPVPKVLGPSLNDEQQAAVRKVSEYMVSGLHRTFLLHGITGSGKTEVYMKLIELALEQDKESILLVPEISLTPQLIDIFTRRFPGICGVTHSRLTDAERGRLWRQAKSGELKVMIGPRSALFTPFASLGLLILDEEHETTYKSEQTPRYNAREVAVYMGQEYQIPVVFGSATPLVEDYYRAEQGEYTLLPLKRRAVEGAALPDTRIIDMREEMAAGNMSIFCRELSGKLRDRLENHEQSILFLNRKGYSTFVSCRSCGFVLKCPRCNLPYTWHKEEELLICHHCGKQVRPVETCPDCGSRYIRSFGTGTQRVEEETKRLFPEAKVLRLDTSVIRGEETYREIYRSFRDHEADILIGTQIVAKGFDFPDVTLVGVLSADMILYAEDFHSTERTFELLTQVAGRAGRADKPGEVLIQTYSPEHYSVQDAASHDYASFYRSELTARRLIQCPPFTHILQFLLTDKNEERLKTQTAEFHRILTYFGEKRGFEILSPAPASLEKINNVYRRRILVKWPERDRLMSYGRYCRDRFIEKYPRSSIQLDIDPIIMV